MPFLLLYIFILDMGVYAVMDDSCQLLTLMCEETNIETRPQECGTRDDDTCGEKSGVRPCFSGACATLRCKTDRKRTIKHAATAHTSR